MISFARSKIDMEQDGKIKRRDSSRQRNTELKFACA